MTTNENQNDNTHSNLSSLNGDVAKYRDSLIGGAEEIDFRARQFLRAFHNPSPDGDTLRLYATRLRDVLLAYSELIKPYTDETIR